MNPSKKYKYLLHYTNYDAFVDIIRSGSIWAGSIAQQNDRSEFSFGMNTISPKLQEIYLSGYKRKPDPVIEKLPDFHREKYLQLAVEHDIKQLIEKTEELCFHDIRHSVSLPAYIASYCGYDEYDAQNQRNTMEDGLLSMWRGYSVNNGVAIVFDSEKLQECIELERERYYYNYISMKCVIYKREDVSFDDEFKEDMKIIDETMPDIFYSETDQAEPDKIKEYLYALYSIACYYKHSGFSEENEVRLLATPWNQYYIDATTAEQRREFGNKLCRESFIRTNPPTGRFISLFDGEVDRRRIFLESICRIIIGPLSAHQDILAQAARRQLRKNDMEHVEVVCSSIPIRV